MGAMCRDASEPINRTRSQTQRGTDQLWRAREETLAFMRLQGCLWGSKKQILRHFGTGSCVGGATAPDF